MKKLLLIYNYIMGCVFVIYCSYYIIKLFQQSKGLIKQSEGMIVYYSPRGIIPGLILILLLALIPNIIGRGKQISKKTKILLIIEVIAFFIILALIMSNQILPDMMSWIFSIGMIGVLVFSFIYLMRKSNSRV